jgi:hypothetical protein
MNTTSQVVTPGRVYLLEFELQDDAFIEGVSYLIGTTMAGNVRVGVYGPIGAEETCNAAPVLVQSDSVPQSGNPNQDQFIPLQKKTLARGGRYYMAIEFDSVSASFLRQPNNVDVTGWSQIYDQPYGLLSNPCPSPTNVGSGMPIVKVRCGPLTAVK